MKYLMILILLLALTESSVGQIREKYIHKHPYTYSSVFTFNSEHIYFNVAKGSFWENNPTNQWLMKYDLGLSPIDSIDLYTALGINSTHYLRCESLEVSGDMLQLLTVEYIFDPGLRNSYKHNSRVSFLDSNLNIISSFEISDSTVGIYLVDLIEFGNSIIGCGFSTNDSTIFPCLVRLDTASYSLQIKVLSDFNPLEVFTKMLYMDSILMVSLSPGISPQSVETLALVDTSFNIIDRKNMVDPNIIDLSMINPGYFIERRPQPPMVISSAEDYTNINLINGSMKMGVAKLDWTYTLTQIDTFRFSGSNSIIPGGYAIPKPFQDAFDYLSADSILFAMSGQEFVNGQGFLSQFASDVYIYNYNAQTEDLNWLRVYNNGYTQNGYVSVEVLPNNQYLVILNEYNWDKYSYPNLSIHLMILNANGDLISYPELPYQREVIRAFPNPCSDHVELSGLEQDRTGTYSYQLIDINGALIEDGAIQEDNQIFFKDDVTGTRVLQVLSEGKLVQSILVMGE